MSKKYLFGFFGISLLLSMVFVSCNDGSNSNNSQSGGNSATYKSKDASGNIYTLIITEQETKAIYETRVGDIYELNIESSSTKNQTSKGTVNSANRSNLELWPFNTPRSSIFSITLSNGRLIGISGTITLTNFETEPAPVGQLTPLN
jgi:hypothetical protein